MDAPGQDLLELIQRMSEKDVATIVGDDLVTLINAIPGIADRVGAIQTVAVRFLHDRAEELFSSAKIRDLLFSSMSSTKQQELASRLGTFQFAELKTFNPTGNIENWQRLLGFFGIDVRSTIRFSPGPTRSNIVALFDLFPYQKGVADRACEVAEDSHGRAIVHMPTGSGKTRTAMHVLCRFLNANYSSLVVWLAGSYELLDQAADAFQTSWHLKGDRSVDLVRVFEPKGHALETRKGSLFFASQRRTQVALSRQTNSAVEWSLLGA